MTSTTHGILVGYDGSPGSEQALRWAAREARWRGTVADRLPRLGAGRYQAVRRRRGVRSDAASR